MREMNKLTPLKIKAISKPGYYGDGGGLWLQVAKGGSKSWVFRYRRDGRLREMGLGPLHTVTLAEAREQARLARRMLQEGIDPIENRRLKQLEEAAKRARVHTFDEVAAAFIKAHRTGWKNPKHAAQWESTIKTYASPVFGYLPVSEVDTGLVLKALEPIWATKPETASRLRGRIEAILDYATVRGYRKGENPARWKGHLDHLLPARGKVRKVEHHPALPWREIGAFMQELRQQEGIAARALEFAILTAARSGEVRGATWGEIDLKARLWIIPAERMKAGREHRVPLSPQAVALLEAMPRFTDTDLVFPGLRGRPLSDMSLTAVLRRMGRGDITVHGFRSTFRDWAAEATAYPREVAEQALAHVIPNKTEAAYRRSDLLAKRARLMADWAGFVDKVMTAADVLPIRSKG